MDIRQTQSAILVILTLIIPVITITFKVPIERIRSSDQQTVKRVHLQRDQSTLQLDGEGRKLNVTRVEKTYFVAKIYVGSRRTQMRVLLDSETSDLWFPSSSCGECDFYCYGIPEIYARSLCKEGCWTIFNNFTGSACSYGQTFNAAESTSYKDDKGAWYHRLFEVGGFRGIDTIDVSGMVFNASIGQVTSIVVPKSYEPVDGVFGLGFPSGSVLKRPPPLLAALQQNLIDKAMFTMFSKKEDAGVFTLGGTDEDNCDANIAYLPLSSETAFQFEIQKLKVGQKTIIDSPTAVLSDSAHAYIYVPKKVLSAIGDALGVEEQFSEYVVDCERSLENLTIMAAGFQFVLTKDVYVEEVFPGYCNLAIRGINLDEYRYEWVLGLPFNQQYCITYDLDNKRIGIAEARNN